jgi:SecD/SecF fusion protein
MRRNFLTGLLICLIPTAIAAVFVGRGFYREAQGDVGFRRGIDLAGGTILVYEVNLEKSLARQGKTAAPGEENATGLSSDDIRKLAESLKRRIDPADLRNVVVRPVGTTRVEIILPYAGSTSGEKTGANEDFVQEVKGLVRQVGRLEFRILANQVDDGPAIRDAEKAIGDAATDPAVKADLEARAKAGIPPRAPVGEFDVTVNGKEQTGVTYEWVELGREERESLGLMDNPPENAKPGQGRGQLWAILEANRGHTYVNSYGGGDDNSRGTASMLLYSRDFVKLTPTQEEQGKKVEYFVLTRVSPTDTLKVDRDVGLTASADTDPTTLNPAVGFGFNSYGARLFKQMTERNKPSNGVLRNLAIVMDDRVVSAPTLNAVLSDRGQISGSSFRMPEVNRLVQILRSGALNAELKPDPVSENTVGPTLGQDTIRKGLEAVVLSFAAVMIFMVIYYRFAGLVACAALLINLLLTVGFMVAVSAAFTLPGLAGLVLMLGMAVDANVLIYERIREERERGATLAAAIRNGYDRAFPTIIDTHLTSIFTAIVLYTFGNDQLKGFAVSLTVGLIISLFTALYMTRLIFDYGLQHRWISQLRMLRLFARPTFHFMRIRHAMLAATAVLTVVGLAIFLYRGEGVLNVDFTKGTLYGGRLKEGQERALNDVGDKWGLLHLLSESQQAERLKAVDAIWVSKPAAENDPNAQTRTNEFIYKIVYADGQEPIVALANHPEGATEEERRDNLKQRASGLPGLSVEQVYLSGERDKYPNGESRLFTVRTTEKEPELVQVMLDRLLRDREGQPLLDSPHVTDLVVSGPLATVTLDRPASPGYLRRFVLRELQLVNRVPLFGNSPAVEVYGVPTEADQATAQLEAQTGRFARIRVDVSHNPEFKALADAAAASTRGGALAGSAITLDRRASADEQSFRAALDSAIKSLQARPIPERLETFDPALAADTRNKALYAVLASWLAILGYLWFRFGSWTFGLSAVLCLVHDLCFTLGAIALCHYLHDTWFGQLLRLQDFKIDLAAVAALLTLVGYSVNDTIVVFDRIKEVRGKNPALTPQMINDSVNGTLSRTVLASLTVFLVVGVLYWFGGEGVHLFSFVMVIGVIVGTYSSIYIASPMLLIFGEGKPRTPNRAAATQTASTTA